MATDAEMTMDVFGEAFMRMVRERLAMVATGDGSGNLVVTLIDKGNEHSPRQEICSCIARISILSTSTAVVR